MMSDEFLRFYNSELEHLRRQGDRFAEANPQIASNLRIGGEGEYDPYVGRLVEAFAYLNARTRQKLEDGYPEVAGSYLDLLYPHYQRPMPSAMICQFHLAAGQVELYDGYSIPRGKFLELPPMDRTACRFRTVYDTRLWPFDLAGVRVLGQPFQAPKIDLPAVSQSLLKVELATQSPDVVFSSFECESLRFHIRLPSPFCYQLYELLFSDVIAVAVSSKPDDPDARELSPENILPVGFAEREGLVDYPPQSFLGYRLLSEFFSFPEKFLFFDVRLPPQVLPQANRLELNFYLRSRWSELESVVTGDSLKMDCCPLVNLFPKRLEPIRLSHHQMDYPLVADARNRSAYEIFSVDDVVGVGENRQEVKYLPFYSMGHSGEAGRFYWFSSRQESQERDELARGSEMRISLVDLDFDPVSPDGWRSTIHVDATCTNRNLPHHLPVVPGQTCLELEVVGATDRCICLTKPSPCRRPPLGKSRRWRLVSQLSLNHLSLTDDEFGAKAMREILELYAFDRSPATQAVIEGLRSVRARPTVGRLPGDVSGAICRGIEITATFDESKYSGGNLFLFAAVLEHFFALYSNINSFTRMVAVSTKRTGEFHRWPARAGKQPVL